MNSKSVSIHKLYDNKTWRPKLLTLMARVLQSVAIKEDAIAEIIESAKTDKQILAALRNLVKKPHRPYNQKANIARAFRKWKFIKPHMRTKINGVLDFGGNIGDAAYVFGRVIAKMPKEKTFVIDIKEWAGEKWEPRDDITFVEFDDMKSISDKKVDLIMASHVLHHINPSHYSDIVELFSSMLSKNGTLVIYEHDCAHNNWAALIDLEHHLFDVVVSKKLTYSVSTKKFYAKYLSLKKWESLFGVDFKIQHIEKLNNPDNSFYMFLQKK
jgi:hypothetical protein